MIVLVSHLLYVAILFYLTLSRNTILFNIIHWQFLCQNLIVPEFIFFQQDNSLMHHTEM